MKTDKPKGITTININTLDELMPLLYNSSANADGRYRESGFYLYRGLPDESYKLLTSLQRNCKDKQDLLEDKLLDNFAKYTAIENPVDDQCVWRRMIVGQHHGLPTRLMDWTHSPLVALHFAVSDSNWESMQEKNCVLWKIDVADLNENLPDAFKTKMNDYNTRILSVDQLNDITPTIADYDSITAGKSMAILEPPSIDPRIVNQYAFFSVVPGNMKDVEEFLDKNTKTIKYVINKDLKWQIRDFLDEINISERTIYPGLDGICKWLARHYYVVK